MKITACDVCRSITNVQTYKIRTVKGDEERGRLFTFEPIDLCAHHMVELFGSYIDTIPESEGKKIQTKLINIKLHWEANGNDRPF